MGACRAQRAYSRGVRAVLTAVALSSPEGSTCVAARNDDCTPPGATCRTRTVTSASTTSRAFSTASTCVTGAGEAMASRGRPSIASLPRPIGMATCAPPALAAHSCSRRPHIPFAPLALTDALTMATRTRTRGRAALALTISPRCSRARHAMAPPAVHVAAPRRCGYVGRHDRYRRGGGVHRCSRRAQSSRTRIPLIIAWSRPRVLPAQAREWPREWWLRHSFALKHACTTVQLYAHLALLPCVHLVSEGRRTCIVCMGGAARGGRAEGEVVAGARQGTDHLNIIGQDWRKQDISSLFMERICVL